MLWPIGLMLAITHAGLVAQKNTYYQSLPIPDALPMGPCVRLGEIRLVKGLNDVETLAKLFPGASLEAVADLDLGV